MNAPRIKFFIVCFCLVFSSRLFAAEPNLVSASQTNLLNAYLQIQEQLHETQMAIASNRQETTDALAQNADAVNTRIQILEQTIAGQRARDAEVAHKTRQTMLVLAGAGMLGLAVMLLIVYFQMRTTTRLVEATLSPSALNFNNGRALPVIETGGEPPLSTRVAAEFSNARLLGVVERLEKRILEWEQTSRAPLDEKNSSTENGVYSGNQQVTDLIVEGQLLLDANEPEKALKNFDDALALEPANVEILIKKAGVLEKLNRFDEAVACYDGAIEADESTTIAYLQKGGLFNRMARYDEALQCYEQALRTQEKNSAREKVAQ